MEKIDLCIDPLFPGLDSTEKIKKISEIGYNAIEFWYWDHEFDGENLLPNPKNIDEIVKITNDLNIHINDIVVNAPDGSIGGSLTNIKDKNIYLDRLKETIEIAHKLKCNKMITCTGNIQEGIPLKAQRDSIIEMLTSAVEIAQKEEMTLVLEALNSTIDHPGYYLTSTREGFGIIREINSPNLRLLYDVYHMQIMEGNLINTITENIDCIGHFHLANLPGRHELFNGEINYKTVIKAIDNLGYNGYIGLEFWPVGDSEKSLIETLKYLQ